jgi:pyridoxamine 5'-phosphate oxidase
VEEPRDVVAGMRRSYGARSLDEADLAPTWLEQLTAWLEHAVQAGVPEPNAMVLATAGATGAPGARTVLLKALDERGLAFYTNLRSRKGREIEANPRAAVTFVWLTLERQVVVDGALEPVTADEADAYYASRPHGAKLAALASRQSEVITSRSALEQRYAELAERHPEGSSVARPEWWGGQRLVPASVEFWQGRENRLHDRLRYRRTDTGAWVVERLAP